MRRVSWVVALIALFVATLAETTEEQVKNESVESASVSTGSSQEEVEESKAYMRTPAVGGVAVRSGEDALLTCVVLGAKGRPVLWRRAKDLRVLTAGGVRVTRDDRVEVLHDDTDEPLPGPGIAKGGDVWALVIKSVKASDAGLYMCELNTEPPVRSFHKLTVISRGLTPPENQNVTDSYSANIPTLSSLALSHNYTDCCVAANVTKSCLGFCSIQTILEGTGQDPETCQPDFPAIVKCMADGRNHVPCCVQERVPDICQDVCRGEFTPVTDNIKTHYSCASYMEKTLACIVEGIELLPSPPEDVEVDPLNEKQLNVSWSPPVENTDSVIEYVVNVTTLRSFDAHLIDPSESSIKNNDTMKTVLPMTYKVPPNKTYFVVNDLLPFTMYEITVTSYNIHGSSLPSYAIRSLTLTPGKMKSTDVAAAPKLPDVRGCCVAAGVNHYGCVDKLCDPTKTFEIALQVTDLMICAPWAGVTFGCLANGMDHTPCCRSKGLPESCLPLCSGNITTLDFNHFKCLRYMNSYTNCLLRGYGVLPGAPSRLYLTNIDTDYAVVHWSPPAALADTVQYYNLHYKTLQAGDEYRVLEKVHSPYILEDLESNMDYEIYLEAVNEHGVGDASPRLIFRTQSQVIEEEEEVANSYNVTACCERVQLAGVCMPLCSYDAKMSDLRMLAPLCAQDFHKLLRCGAGGRNHEQCCARRGVPSSCRGVCAGAYSGGVNSCVPYIGNIVQCFEEGTGLLPGPPRELHALVNSNSVFLDWSTPQDGANATSYVVYWQKIDNNSQPYSYNTMQSTYNKLNVSDTLTHINDLEKNSTYHVFVVAANVYGESLPSSMLLFNVSETEEKEVAGIPSPPHSLSVSSHSATWLTLTWQPPQFSQPDEKISYTLFYKSPAQLSQANVTNITTTVPGHTLEKLAPNTQYVIWVKAHATAGDSQPSETLLAWTDPAYPAYVEPPSVNPVNLVVEGSSMTILCIAMGTPTPTISLYISGRLVRQEVTRHMVTVIHNVTRDMDQISCYADNGYGTPMQASRKINISHVPTIQASGITMAAAGDAVILECRVEALPKPTIAFWRDPNGRTPVIDGPNYTIQLLADPEEQTKYTMRLIIKKIAEADEGDYFCHAENAFGKTLRPVSVRLRPTMPHHNVTACCTQMNVSSSCIDACSFHLEMDNIMDRPECMNDFDKLMKCAADGSDHRSCCASWGVPRQCLELCRGGVVSRSCAMHHARRALACFRDAGPRLPGPPRNLRAHHAPTPNSVLLSWEPPLKNPQTVYLYRVFWRAYGAKVPEKLDTSETSVVLTGLQDDVKYECVVKAANDVGTSSLSTPIMFTTAGQETGAAAAPVTSGGAAPAVGVAVACLLVAAILLAAGFYYRYRKNLRLKAQGGVAFENPSYLREPNPDTAVNGTMPNGSANGSNGTNGVAPMANGVSNSAAWRQETLNNPGTTVPNAREVDPTLYEELKLGHDGAGFKRLKP
ncbi:Ig-like and fibronectin type-III domain-containing protein 1 isoform X1 [Spodoptera frugiperda]|uniref:Ig-like and fibronectin type-III domain-containing protein 1 isoform X1 n=2 Tax=Spodoptera frugiperda TaxID=7108 RepID=A0A9R0ELV8_SPOFR|nr:Ig-like and fibronectin type-III domain-containing protein 1 isoform X1 [Spodoptera frugiperda]